MRAVSLSAASVMVAAAVLSAQDPPVPATMPPAQAAPVATVDRWQPEKPVVVQEEPHHRQLFQHGTTRILDLQLPPGDISWFHSHDWPVFYLTLTTSQTRTQIQGMEWGARLTPPGGRAAAPRAGGPPRAGGAAPPRAGGPGRGPGGGGPPLGISSTTSYIEQPVIHRLENLGNGLFRAMVVVNETPGDTATTEQAAGFTAKPEFSNGWFRAYRIALAPGERTAAHKHNAPVVILQATAGKGAGVGAVTWEFNTPGQWAYFDVGDTHAFANTGDARLELIEVEVRKPVGGTK